MFLGYLDKNRVGKHVIVSVWEHFIVTRLAPTDWSVGLYLNVEFVVQID